MGKIITTIVISVLVFFSLFGIILIAAGIKIAYFSPYSETYYLPETINGHIFSATEHYSGNNTEGSIAMGIGATVLLNSLVFLGVFIHFKVRDSKNESKMKAEFERISGKHGSEAEFILGQYKKKNYGNPCDVLETRLKAKIALGKKEKEAIQELYEEAKS